MFPGSKAVCVSRAGASCAQYVRGGARIVDSAIIDTTMERERRGEYELLVVDRSHALRGLGGMVL